MNFSRFNPNIGAGVYLKSENFYFSFVPRMLSTERYKPNGLVTQPDQIHLYHYGFQSSGGQRPGMDPFGGAPSCQRRPCLIKS